MRNLDNWRPSLIVPWRPPFYILDVKPTQIVDVPSVGCCPAFTVDQVKRPGPPGNLRHVRSFPLFLELSDVFSVRSSPECQVSILYAFPNYFAVSPFFGLFLVFCNIFDGFQSCAFDCLFGVFFIFGHCLFYHAEALIRDFFR